VAVFVHRLDPLEILLLKRTPERGGFWQPVTGRAEATDLHEPAVAFERFREADVCPDLPTVLSAGVREVEEETGIAAVEVVIDLGLESVFTGFDGQRYRERALAARVPRGAVPVMSAEHTEMEWVDADAAARRFVWDENREALRRLLTHLGTPAGSRGP
jgi:8-oxo-dGTP pyrophosphatase MutT (NUDIX family)